MIKRKITSIFLLLICVILINVDLSIYLLDYEFIDSTRHNSDLHSKDLINSASYKLESNKFTIPDIPQLFEYDINLIFLGINNTILNESSLVNNLPQWYAPIDEMQYWFDNKIVFDINFSLRYHPYYLDQEVVQNYRDFLYNNSKEDLAPCFIQPEYTKAHYIHSSLVEEYLTQNIIIDQVPTLIIIDTYSFDPSNHTPYYYNSTYNELDAEFRGYLSNPVPWGSTYQIAGGAKNSRLLWLDLSAGPTFYAGYSFESTEGEVSNVTIPPIWTYEGLIDAKSKLTQDLVIYVTKAIETRILPSYTYIPPSPTKEVKFEMIMIDFDPSDYDYFSSINGSYIISEYQRINPLINWTYSISNWDWESDDDFIQIINTIFDNSTNVFYIQEFLSYFDDKFKDLFNASTLEKLIIPIILFTYPSHYRFEPDWGGFTKTIYDEDEGMWKFGYTFCRLDSQSADPDFIESDSVSLNNFEISNGSIFINSASLGTFNERFELSVDVNTGFVNMYFLDDYNYNRFNHSLPFIDLFNNSMEKLSNISGIKELRVPIKIKGLYHLILENIGNSSSFLNISLSLNKDWMAGFTWKTMHEIGHAIGLQHPHQGFSWKQFNPQSTLSGMYYYWLWDFSYSQVNYAHNAPTISLMDIDTARRGMIPRYWKKAVNKMEIVLDRLNNPELDSLDNISVHLMNVLALINQSIANYSDINDPSNYYNSLEAVFLALEELEFMLSKFKITTANNFILPVSIGVGAILILSTSYIILRMFKKKKSLE